MYLSLSLFVGFLNDARQLLQLGALVQGNVLPGHYLLLDFGYLVPEGLFVLVDVVVVEMLFHLFSGQVQNKNACTYVK